MSMSVSASMTRYQLVEPHNQRLSPVRTATLTPGLERTIGDVAYRSLDDLRASVESRDVEGGVELESHGTLVDREQRPADPPTAFLLAYRITDDSVRIRVRATGGARAVRFSLPIVSAQDEAVALEGGRELQIAKRGGTVRLQSSQPLCDFTTERVFNHVPGHQALAVAIELPVGEEAVFELSVF
jgi:hypothetical protein